MTEFSNEIQVYGLQCTNVENFRNIGRRVKASVKLVFVKEVLQIFHFLKIEIQHCILNESCTESSQPQWNIFSFTSLNYLCKKLNHNFDSKSLKNSGELLNK